MTSAPRSRAIALDRLPPPPALISPITTGTPGFDDSGLLERDLLDRRPEIALVVEGNRGDGGRRPASTTLVASSRPPSPTSSTATLDAGAPKQLERGGGRDFEECRRRGQRPLVEQAGRRLAEGRRRRRESASGLDRSSVDRRTARSGRPGAATCSAPTDVRPRAAPSRPSRSPSLCRSCRRCAPTGTCAPGCPSAFDQRGDVVEAELDAELFEAEEIGERIQQGLGLRD